MNFQLNGAIKYLESHQSIVGANWNACFSACRAVAMPHLVVLNYEPNNDTVQKSSIQKVSSRVYWRVISYTAYKMACIH